MRPEHRKSPRITKRLPAVAERVATLLDKGRNRIVRIVVVDVSREGVGFVSPEPFDPGAFVRLTIEMKASNGFSQTGQLFVTGITIRNCTSSPGGGFHVEGGYKVGAVVKEHTGRQWAAWNELIRLWSQKVL